jgi:SAM-dependent methyltransferase/methyltransferase-like protein
MPTAYDQVLYRGLPFAQTHPDRLATMGILFGLEPANVARCRVLELGCGDGGNLIPMAVELPGSEFVGIDLAQSGIDSGLAVVASLRLRNIRLERRDILDISAELGNFDYIIAHGVYSWTPAPVREKLLAIAGELLMPHGIAYISYNALPGCRTRQMYRDMLQFHGRDAVGPEQRLEKAREFLREAVSMQESRGEEGVYLKSAAQALLEKDPAVLYHDELSEIYHPVLFHQFAAHAAAHGLQFLAEASYRDMCPRDATEAAMAFAESSAAGDRVARQQYFDFLRNRSFRQTLLCRSGLAVAQDAVVGRVCRLYAASAAKPVSSTPDMRAGAAEEFRGFRGAAVTTAHPVVKAAMVAMGRKWPGALSFEELFGAASEMADEAPDVESLAGFLLAAFGSGLVELQAVRPRCVARAGSFPITTALARWQASNGLMITTPRHKPVEAAGAFERRVIALLDGSRDVAMLTRELAPAVNRREEVEATLEKLADLGLLIA